MAAAMRATRAGYSRAGLGTGANSRSRRGVSGMYWERLTTKGFREEVMGKVDTAILATGSVEAHGLHCPLGTDNLAPAYFAARLEERFSDRIIVLPPVPFGHTWDLEEWPGTLSVSGETFSRYVAEIGRAVVGWGIRHIVIMNGHGGNTAPLESAMEQMADAGARVFLVEWWRDYRDDILSVTSRPGHAGEDETSVMLAIAGPWVRMQDASFNPYTRRLRMKAKGMGDRAFRHATTGDGRPATREKGERIIAMVVDKMAAMLEDIWADRVFDPNGTG